MAYRRTEFHSICRIRRSSRRFAERGIYSASAPDAPAPPPTLTLARVREMQRTKVRAPLVAVSPRYLSVCRNRRRPRRFFVAQIFNLLYRRIAFGPASLPPAAQRITNPRYGRMRFRAPSIASPPRCAVSHNRISPDRSTAPTNRSSQIGDT